MKSEVPGLTCKLGRVFGSEAIDWLEVHFDRVVQLGGNYEEGLMREEGVSFNPRVARIASLVLEHSDNPIIEVIAAAMWSLVPEQVAELQGNAPEVYDLVVGVFEQSEGSAVNPTSATIRAVLLLDRLRHLHMTSFAVAEKATVLQEAASSSVFSEEFPISQELRAKVEHAIRLQQRNVDEQ